MAHGPMHRFCASLERDAALAAAIRRLPAARPSGRSLAEHAVRAAAIAATFRALGCMLRDLLSRSRAASASRPASPAVPGHQPDAAAP